MMLDEIDKLGAGIHGDPAAAHAGGARSRAEQHVPRQLSRRAVRPSARGVHRHRQHARHHSGAAARPHGDHQPRRLHGRARSCRSRARYLVRRQMEANGLKAGAGRDRRRRRCARSSTHYTREAGVRSLEREIGQALRHAAVRIAEGESGPIRIDAERSRRRSSAAPRFENEVAMRTSVPGVATGLAWTPVGGDILFIEATRMPGARPADPHRPARRRDAGKRAGGAEPSSRTAPPRSASMPAVREDRHPRPRAGGRDRRRTGRARASPCSWR